MFKIFKDTRGATAIEYGLLAGLVSVGTLVAVTSAGTETQQTFDIAAYAMSPEGRLAATDQTPENLETVASSIVANSTP